MKKVYARELKEQVLNALRAIYRNEYAGSDRGSTVPEHS